MTWIEYLKQRFIIDWHFMTTHLTMYVIIIIAGTTFSILLLRGGK